MIKKYCPLILTLFLMSTNLNVLHAKSELNPFGPWYLNDQPTGWYFDAFLGFEREPTYTGSDRYTSEADANFQAFYKSDTGKRYFLSLGEFGGFFELGNGWLLGTLLEYEEGRENSEDPILADFPEVENTWEAQISLVKRWGNISLATVFQPDILSRGKGLVYFVGISHDTTLSNKLRINTSLDISFSDAEHINTEVGISEAVATLSGLNAYEAKSGYKSTTLSLSLGYQFAESWQFISNLEAEFYGSNMADSPLIKQEGSSLNYEIGVGVLYSF